MYRPISRRTALRGLVAGSLVNIALPPLDIFFNQHGTAYADGGFPKRLLLFFWGNGVLPDRWLPNTTGPNWALTEQLLPLAPVKEDFTLISGMEVKVLNRLTHISGPAGLFSGADIKMYGPEDYSFTQPTFDQLIAGHIGNQTRFRSLEVGVSPFVKGLSYNGVDSVNPPESSLTALFNRLFGTSFRAPGDDPIFDPKLALRRSVLDGVIEDSKRLKKRLGQVDKQRVDQHLQSIRELERNIAALEADPPNLAACHRPSPPPDFSDMDARPPMSERTAALADLICMTFACDQTRVLSTWYTDPFSDVLFPEASAGHHQLTHDEPGDQPQVNTIVKGIMGDLGQLIQKLKSIPEGEATLLDHSLLFATTDVGYGRSHQINEYPMILAGGGGEYTMGIHHRYEFAENATNVTLSLMRSMGMPLSSFGENDAYTERGLPELERNS
jgi:hypothetical protein